MVLRRSQADEDIEAEINGQPRSLRLVFLNAWTKTPKGWKFIAWQSTPQPAT
jgi:hypothetical protein